MAGVWFANLNYICNERCVFCAAGLSDGPKRTPERPRGLTVDDVERWIGDERPVRGDTVMLAGGEPTLHPRLLEVVRRLSTDGAEVSLFTNGLRLSDPGFAESVVDAGVGELQIGLFGARGSTHDAVTRRAGSFERTLQGLRVLRSLKVSRTFQVEVRLLVARQCLTENPAIVRLLDDDALRPDSVSLNRLILSREAGATAAAVPWSEARASANECLTLLRASEIRPAIEALPLCIWEGENARWVAARLAAARPPRSASSLRYLDPFTAVGKRVHGAPPRDIAATDACDRCELIGRCGGVEQWYVDRFGEAGLRPLRAG
jgi:MoaA/NifB/PqqE/SkfB family radical SAM enzyme